MSSPLAISRGKQVETVPAPNLQGRDPVRFTVEQVFLTNSQGFRTGPAVQYHLVEAETVDEALAAFLRSSSATLVGTVRRFPGLHVVATARTNVAVFTVNVLPGSDIFHLRR